MPKVDAPESLKELEHQPSHYKIKALQDEMRSISTNDVWDLKEIPKGAKIVGCNESTKSKCDSNGNVERYKVQLVAKGIKQSLELYGSTQSFCHRRKEHMRYRQMKPIYEFRQASRQ